MSPDGDAGTDTDATPDADAGTRREPETSTAEDTSTGQDGTVDAASPDGGVETADTESTTHAPGPETPVPDDPEDTDDADAAADGASVETDVAADDAGAPTDAPGGPRAGDVSLSTLFEVLGNERRRHVIHVLRERETVGLAALAEAVAAREHDVEPDALTRRQERTTYSALQQTHLPKMDAAGVLSFDKDAGEVTAGDAIVEYTMYLDVVPSGGLRDNGRYLQVSAAGVVVAAGLWAGLPPFVWVSPLVWGGLFVLVVAVVAVVQLYYHPLLPERLPVG